MGFCNCSTFCCALLCVHSSFAIILIGKGERAGCFALFVFMVSRVGVWLFLTMPRVCLQFVIVVFPDDTHVLFLETDRIKYKSLTQQNILHANNCCWKRFNMRMFLHLP